MRRKCAQQIWQLADPPDIPVDLWFDNTLAQSVTSDNPTVGAKAIIADYIDARR